MRVAHQLHVWEQAFDAHPASVAAARCELRQTLAAWGWTDSGQYEDLVLISSELISNAITHASRPGDRVHVRLQEIGGDCRLEVQDRRPDLLPPRTPRPQGEHGRGLLLVRGLAKDMDVVTTRGSKIVWARVLLGTLPERAA
ncbi:ATP-binding protein [Kitasatospora sp. NPDC094015]|uniref:ATP-binding protein n=1 Tax=Kitasatospora sp. NPDC094015 TaxID=3155205 RepID=UPI00332C7D37